MSPALASSPRAYAAGPRPVRISHRGVLTADTHSHLRRRDLGDERVEVRAFGDGLRPVGMLVGCEVLALGAGCFRDCPSIRGGAHKRRRCRAAPFQRRAAGRDRAWCRRAGRRRAPRRRRTRAPAGGGPLPRSRAPRYWRAARDGDRAARTCRLRPAAE